MSTATTVTEFSVLHALKVRGLAGADALAESAGVTADEVVVIMDAAVEQGWAKLRSGRVSGYMLTSPGRERYTVVRAENVTEAEVAGLTPVYQQFLAPNQSFKEVTTDWQLKAEGDIAVVLPRLDQVHDQVVGVIDEAGRVTPRFTIYRDRFERAIAAFRGGDGAALAKPMSGSYHDVWMELHEDLLATLGLERTDADG
jgi:hypothetical protein